MNERIKQFAELSKRPKTILVDGLMQSVLLIDPEKFADLVVDECILKLLDMDENAKGNHNYYKHAALEVKRHFNKVKPL